MTDKIQQARRAAFEKWANQHRMPIGRDGVVVDYSARETDACWQVFNAALDAVEIELPESCRQVTIDDESIDIYWPNEVRAAIESTNLGIKVK